ncbi:MAG: class I SAM-dependent methyltransferase [Oscillatoria sp. PMC 1051.18]|uniref:class I SAM-dependent methyltransferase n=1 Tax=Oscillatoria salina TaxID=331517 RepID=UPI0013B8C105|nr:class I SAM-dependent methyltransferase [Oscillatoria salina]MBZ8181671.1 class I SAM-dependent methyltransferase [Oscillatoria salina IIICB1]MEC4894983.1 class I SAM-dependent methyltransferase [Oscillatoria sp. PMC 1050.18]MEC5031601.1 class I SAM-dependent methyltransferase [Oscillatoria sp. PMC 1051.18]NET90674.1 class I SAM-dependent methyltransferase [Kamptonema sp. SIO1D9]
MNAEAKNKNLERDWVEYYEAVKNRPPRDTLLQALDYFDAEKDNNCFAVDLGCGDGRDTVELLRRGWRVLGIDGESKAISRLCQRPDIDNSLLETQVMRFEELELPKQVDLINASFSIIFCPPLEFATLWQKIINSLRSGGRFCGQLLGDRDSWAVYSNLNSHPRSKIEELLQSFVIETLIEEEHPGKTPLGEEKHWHLFQIVAKKR